MKLDPMKILVMSGPVKFNFVIEFQNLLWKKFVNP